MFWGGVKKFLCALGAVLALLTAHPAIAVVSGPCSNCHTMHNSQDAQSVVDNSDNNSLIHTAPENGPNPQLLKTDCLGCHMATDGNTAISSIGAPIVYNTAPPTYGTRYKNGPHQGLAGGNFYFVEHVADDRGHNVMVDNPDDVLPKPPSDRYLACGTTSCHENLNTVYVSGSHPASFGRQGCTKCHMLPNEETTSEPALPNNIFHHLPKLRPDRYAGRWHTYWYPGWEFGGLFGWVNDWYRFLSAPHGMGGVRGCEDPDWELTSSANDHNDYLEKTLSDASRPLAQNTLSGFCAGCHTYFCSNQTSSFTKHPAFAAVIPNTGEYANAFGSEHAYDPLIPIGQPNLSAAQAPKPTVELGVDRVGCMTCHRAHGSPYRDMLRFDPDEMLAGGGPGDGEGCFKCHTAKDGS